MNNSKSVTQDILTYIKEHPGCRRRDIDSVVPSTITYGSASSIIAYLRLKGDIENRGGHGKAARWYTPNSPYASKFYQDTASELLNELRSIQSKKRPEYLAERLQNIFGDP